MRRKDGNDFLEEESERHEACGKAVQENKEKKPLDPKWIDECMDLWIGPWLAIMMARDSARTRELMSIIRRALTDFYEESNFQTTNEWVVAAYDRMRELMNTFITARLIELYDNGVPDRSGLVIVGSGKKIMN